MAIQAVSDALTGEGSAAVFTGDSDPELVGSALPFAIKMYESLLANNPNHDGLILTTGSLFVMYANAFVQGPGEILYRNDYAGQKAVDQRAKGLYLRGAAILSGGLEKKFPGFNDAYTNIRREGSLEKIKSLLVKAKKEDVPLLYWTVAGTLSAYSVDFMDLSLGSLVPGLALLIERAYELDPDFSNGAIDDFYILFHAKLPPGLGANPALAKIHFERAVAKSGGLSASPFVSYAQAVLIPAQDYPAFKENLQKALAIDVDAVPETRLANIIAQRKARDLLDHAPDHFSDLGEDEALYYGDYDDYDDYGDDLEYTD
jgi:predicted anti-sigma-YlaC factor YlaD